MSIDHVLSERQATHGDFVRVAETYDALVGALADGCTRSNRPKSAHWAALSMIAMKLARIANGDPNHLDHWRDIAGYAELALRASEAPPAADRGSKATQVADEARRASDGHYDDFLSALRAAHPTRIVIEEDGA